MGEMGTGWLEREHGLIASVLAATDAMQRRTSPVSLCFLAAVLAFFEGLVRLHEEKEDRALLPVLSARGILPDGGMLARIGREHVDGRRRLAQLRADVRRPGAPVRDATAAFARLASEHLAGEDGEILPAVAELSGPDVERVANACQMVDAEYGGPTAYARFVDLGAALGTASAAFTTAPSPDRPCARDLARVDLPPILPSETLARAAEIMRLKDVRGLPVLADGVLIGFLAKSDLEPYRGHEEWTVVATAMTRAPVTVAPDVPISDVARILVDRSFNAVPVALDGIALGLVGQRDLLAVL